jgi:hypothetical protein
VTTWPAPTLERHRVDRGKYAGRPYVGAMISDRPCAATMKLTPRGDG